MTDVSDMGAEGPLGSEKSPARMKAESPDQRQAFLNGRMYRQTRCLTVRPSAPMFAQYPTSSSGSSEIACCPKLKIGKKGEIHETDKSGIAGDASSKAARRSALMLLQLKCHIKATTAYPRTGG